MLRSYVAESEGPRRSVAELARLKVALGSAGLGCTGREISHLWCLLEGMLHLGNLTFVDGAAADAALDAAADAEGGYGYGAEYGGGGADDGEEEEDDDDDGRVSQLVCR